MMNYELIYSITTETNSSTQKGLNDLVNEKLNNGYALYGSPGIQLNSKSIPTYYQAVVKHNS